MTEASPEGPVDTTAVRSDPPLPASDEGGDAACWAHRVCQECGRLAEAEHPEVCTACGAAFPVDVTKV